MTKYMNWVNRVINVIRNYKGEKGKNLRRWKKTNFEYLEIVEIYSYSLLLIFVLWQKAFVHVNRVAGIT